MYEVENNKSTLEKIQSYKKRKGLDSERANEMYGKIKREIDILDDGYMM